MSKNNGLNLVLTSCVSLRELASSEGFFPRRLSLTRQQCAMIIMYFWQIENSSCIWRHSFSVQCVHFMKKCSVKSLFEMQYTKGSHYDIFQNIRPLHNCQTQLDLSFPPNFSDVFSSAGLPPQRWERFILHLLSMSTVHNNM